MARIPRGILASQRSSLSRPLRRDLVEREGHRRTHVRAARKAGIERVVRTVRCDSARPSVEFWTL